MKRISAILLTLILTAAVVSAQETDTGSVQGKAHKQAASKSFRWHGIIQRHNDDKSTLDSGQ